MKVHVMWVPGADLKRDNIVHRLRSQFDACLHEDPHQEGLMQNWLGILRCAMKDDLPWTLILSDDAQPLLGWQEELPQALENSPHPFLGLTHFGGYGEKAVKRGYAYCEGPYLIWGGAMAVRSEHLPGLLEFAEYWHSKGYPHDDVITCAYAYKIGELTAVTSRAVFDQPVKKSLLNHNTPIRNPTATISNTEFIPYTSGAMKMSRGISPRDELQRLVADYGS